MEIAPAELAKKIVEAYKLLPKDKRLLVAIAGPPGSGKSTLAYPLTDALNAIILHHAPMNPSSLVQPESSDIAEPSKAQGSNDEVAICVGLDGWHYSRKDMDGFDDPKEAHWRRGAAFTFNLKSYSAFLKSLREPLTSSKAIEFPTFDHAVKDPTPSDVPVLPQHRIVLIEGLHCLRNTDGWEETVNQFDLRIFVEVDRTEARNRIVKRNFQAGIITDYKACEERVDAVDMMNGEEVRKYRIQPDYIITSIEDHPFSKEAFSEL
ncbi:uncharacterized protein I206_104192 [Kwoniella pini CBS 10737]|uniref:Phosphoribulokinase/uridine kinase domain-containing protein n=1 Tax=Kwoniella pini CBS 10737 TaxID=1296096 RepID=A0A1B9I2F1_9TREE|nr:uncharacterized protein I206_04233 [Kwoniella pini CBS 10737]OCF49709.1 hypothetical protein I206_04233 [Kwoniella pini CBS 10737]